MGDEPIFGLMMVTSTDETYIEQSLTSFLESKRVTEVNVLVSQGHYFNGREIPEDRTLEILESLGPKVNITTGEWPSEEFDRNLAMSLFEESNMILVFDADEILLSSDLDRLLDWIEEHPKQLYSMTYIGYWKSLNHRLVIGQPTNVVAVSRDVCWVTDRIARGYRQMNIPADEIVYHHFGFALPPEAQLEKCRRASLHPSWYERIWKGWTPGMQNLHPTSPTAWHDVVEVEPDPELVEYLARFETEKLIASEDQIEGKAKADEGSKKKRRSKPRRSSGRRRAEDVKVFEENAAVSGSK